MAFKVVSTLAADRDVKEIVKFISRQSNSAAMRGASEFEDVIKNLKEFPLRFALIPENQGSGNLYRSCPYHSHRIIYHVDETKKVVYIVRVYHVARTPLQSTDFD